MKKRVLSFVAVSLFLASPVMAASAIVSGKKLLANCNTPETSVAQQNICLGVIIGTIDTHSAFINNNLIQPLYCPPNKVTLRQMKGIVVKFLENHPKNLHQSGTLLATKALVEAFPCSKSQPSK